MDVCKQGDTSSIKTCALRERGCCESKTHIKVSFHMQTIKKEGFELFGSCMCIYTGRASRAMARPTASENGQNFKFLNVKVSEAKVYILEALKCAEPKVVKSRLNLAFLLDISIMYIVIHIISKQGETSSIKRCALRERRCCESKTHIEMSFYMQILQKRG